MPKLKRPAIRTLWLKVHLYLALTVGFLFAIIGLTGSLSVYHDELDGWLNPHLTIDQPQGSYQSLDKMLAAGDRVEIYRPLSKNPMEARRSRLQR